MSRSSSADASFAYWKADCLSQGHGIIQARPCSPPCNRCRGEIVGAADRHGAVAASSIRRSAPAMMSRTWCTTSGFTEIDVMPNRTSCSAILGSVGGRLATQR